VPLLTRSPLPALRRRIRRHRRPLAAALAAAGVLVALTALRAPVPATSATGPDTTVAADPTALRPGEASVPVLLGSSALAGVLQPGDVVDLVAASPTGEPEIVAAGVRVLERPSGGSGLAPSSGGLVVVAVAADDAVDVAVTSSRDDLTVVIRSSVVGPDGRQ
jgi:hypothetical protein